MSNVKPGDFAKVVGATGSAVDMQGALVLVLDGAAAKNFQEYMQLSIMRESYGLEPIWRIEVLEARRTRFQGLIRAGDQMFAMDSSLKRIDPPEDEEDIFGTAPLQSEKEPIHG